MKRVPVKPRIPPKKVEAFCNRNGIREMPLFGSFARGEGHSQSNVDLLVQFDPAVQFGLLAFVGMKLELSKLLGRKVDLVERAALKPDIRADILADAKVIFAAT